MRTVNVNSPAAAPSSGNPDDTNHRDNHGTGNVPVDNDDSGAGNAPVDTDGSGNDDRSQGNNDPPWYATGRRDEFGYPSHSHVLRDRRRQPKTVPGFQWTTYSINTDRDLALDPVTQTVRPWIAPRPDAYDQPVPNFPVAIPVPSMDKQMFLTSYCNAIDPQRHKRFKADFPVCSSVTSLGIFQWYENLVQHGHVHGCFIPPPCSFRRGKLYGTWLKETPAFVQNGVHSPFKTLLAQSLREKKTGLIDDSTYGPLVRGYASDGYRILYAIMIVAGHPQMQEHPTTLASPKQEDTVPLDRYLRSWNHYLMLLMLQGTFWSDRFFIQEFIRDMHPTVKGLIGDRLQSKVNRVDPAWPLPEDYSPDGLLTTLVEAVNYAGKPTLISTVPGRPYHQPLPPPHTV